MDDGAVIALVGLAFLILSSLVAVLWRAGTQLGRVLSAVERGATDHAELKARVGTVEDIQDDMRNNCAAFHGLAPTQRRRPS